MRRTLAALSIVTLCAFANAARAASLDLGASELNGNSVVATNLGPGLLAIDPAFTSAAPIELVILLDAEDAGVLGWNALVDNLTGEVWSAFVVEVIGATGLEIGSVVANAGVVAGIATTASSATIGFDPAEPAGIDLGAPFGVGEDWVVTVGTAPSFRLRLAPVAVPEPASLLAVALGLTLLARIRPPSRG